jgi:hypothetical protein
MTRRSGAPVATTSAMRAMFVVSVALIYGATP